jgi:hypothetical protein
MGVFMCLWIYASRYPLFFSQQANKSSLLRLDNSKLLAAWIIYLAPIYVAFIPQFGPLGIINVICLRLTMAYNCLASLSRGNVPQRVYLLKPHLI